jgi:LysM repeat protein
MKLRSILVGGSLVLITVLSLVLVPFSSAEGPLPGEGQFIQITVKTGESLAKFATIYGTSGSAMLAVNSLPNPDLVFPGQTLVIPVVKTRTPSLTTPFYYFAQPGDTLTSVSDKFHMDAFNISFANDTLAEQLVPGQVYLIPAGPHHEIVQRGEHLGIYSAWYGVTISALLKANPTIADPSQVLVGQRVNIPIQYDARPVPLPAFPVTATPLPAAATATAFVIVPATATAVPTSTNLPVVFPTLAPRPTATSIAIANNFIQVVVLENESLITYVKRYGVDGSSIVAVNPKLQVNPDLIFPGQVITIPVVITFNPSRTTPFFYTVGGGDTVFTIANKFEMTTDTLIAANPKAGFQAGTSILVPAGPHVYVIKPGENLNIVAAKYLVKVDTLLKANPSLRRMRSLRGSRSTFRCGSTNRRCRSIK